MTELPQKSCSTVDYSGTFPTVEDILATRPWVCRMLRKMRLSTWDIEDILQETFVAAWDAARRGVFKPNASRSPDVALRSWVYGIAWRQAVARCLRKPWRREVLDEEAFSDVSGPDPMAQVEARDALLALSELPIEQASLLATAVEYDSVLAYAEAVGVNVYTTHHQLQRARKALAKRIGRRM